MNKTKLMFALLLAGLVLGACRGSDDESKSDGNASVAYTETTLSEAPQWQMDWTHNQERPDWKEPDASLYENWTILMIKIEEALQPYVSDGDMMALFANGELHGLARPAVGEDGQLAFPATFLMKAYGNETSTEAIKISLKYYNQKLRHIFTQFADISYDSDVNIGIDDDFIPGFTYGSAKYPVMKAVNVEALLAGAGIKPAADNKVAAFVGDECRGTATLSPIGNTPMVIYGYTAGEQVTLKYYDATAGKLYTIPDAVKL